MKLWYLTLRHLTWLSCCTLLACCALPSMLADARDIYVSNAAGDDRSTGDFQENITAGAGPVQTIAKALRLALPGDHVVLANTGQPYRESVSISGNRLSGLGSIPLVIIGNGAILDGSLPVPDRAWEHYLGDVFRFQPTRIGHQQLFLDDRPALRRPATSLDWKVPNLEPREWCLVGGYIYFCVEQGKLPQDYSPTYAALPAGITLYKTHDVVIGDLTVQGFQLDGINAFDGAFDIVLNGVTCRGNGRSGLSVGGSSRVVLRDSVLGDNGAAQLRTEGYSHTTVNDSQLIPNTAPAVSRHGGQVMIDGTPVDAEDVPAGK